MKNSKLNKKDLQDFTSLLYGYLNATYSGDLRNSMSSRDLNYYYVGSLSDLQDFAQVCINLVLLEDVAPFCHSDYSNNNSRDSAVFYHEKLPAGMWKDFFDVLQRVQEYDAETSYGAYGFCFCDELILELTESNVRRWIEENISEEDYRNYKAVYDAGMEEILVDPARGFLWDLLRKQGIDESLISPNN